MAQAIAVGGQIAVLGTTDDGVEVALLEAATGAVVGGRALGHGCVPVPAAGATSLLARCGGALVVIDPATLAERWRGALGGTTFRVTARGDLVVASVDVAATPAAPRHKAVVAFEATGRTRWRTTMPTERGIGVAEDAERVYVFEGDPTVWALDRQTGAILWATPMTQPIADVVALGDGTLAVVREGEVVRLDGAAGAEAEVLVPRGVHDLAVAGSWIFTIEDPGEDGFRAPRLHGRDLATGQQWIYPRPIDGSSALTFGDGVVHACSPTGTLHAIDRARGTGRWWADTGGACGAITVGGVTLVGLDRGTDLGFATAAIDPARRSRAPWATIRGRFRDGIGATGVRGHRVWIGDRVVVTDARGRFSARVRRGARVSVTLDPRDVGLGVEGAVLGPGDPPRVELASYYEDCH